MRRDYREIQAWKLAEVGYYIYLSKRSGFIDYNSRARLNELQEEAASALYGLIKSIQKNLIGLLSHV